MFRRRAHVFRRRDRLARLDWVVSNRYGMHARSSQNVPTRRLCCDERDWTGGFLVSGGEFEAVMDPTKGQSFPDLARILSAEDATPEKLKSVTSMAGSIAAKLQLAADAGPGFSLLGQAAATNLQPVDWLHSKGLSWPATAAIIVQNLGGAETVIHHGGSDHLVVTAALEEVRQTDCEVPKFLNLLTVSATVTEVCQWAATELQFPRHTSLVTLGRFC